MRHCPSCGGIIGKDCFNPIECAEITERQAQQNSQDWYEKGKVDGSVGIIENPTLYEIKYGNEIKILISGVNVQILNAVNGWGHNCKNEITLTEINEMPF